MSKRQSPLVKFQSRKPYPKKTQFVVSCARDGSIKRIEKLQNKEMMRGLSKSADLTGKNRIFLEERCNDGTMDDLVTLVRAVWDNFLVGKLIALVEQSNRAIQKSPGAKLQGIDESAEKAHGGGCYQ